MAAKQPNPDPRKPNPDPRKSDARPGTQPATQQPAAKASSALQPAQQGAAKATAPSTGSQRSDAPSPQGLRGPSHEEIARRAFTIYQQRGGQDGQDLQDWLQAERELRARTRT